MKTILSVPIKKEYLDDWILFFTGEEESQIEEAVEKVGVDLLKPIKEELADQKSPIFR